MKGVVIKSTGNLCQVLSGDKVFSCKIKGKTRLLNIEFTNPISVGDHVDFNYDEMEYFYFLRVSNSYQHMEITPIYNEKFKI